MQAIIFDLDGVLYNGSTPVPKVAETIKRLQKKFKVLFLTNNSTKSRSAYAKYLQKFGVFAKEDEVMTSSFGVFQFIKENFGKNKKVFVIGEDGLKEEIGKIAKIVNCGKIDIVVCGLDRNISYEKYDIALQALNQGAKFILANADPTIPKEMGVGPGSGAIASPLIYASKRKPDAIIGKPSIYLLKKLLSLHNLSSKDCIFVGDRLDIDIKMAKKAKMTSVLVLSGVSKKKDIEKSPYKPDFVLKTAAELEKIL
jgi:HAD superfamily hydrolase (TIGR01450 family)